MMIYKLFILVSLLIFIVFSAFAENIITVWTKNTGFRILVEWDDSQELDWDVWRYDIFRSKDKLVEGIMISPGTIFNPYLGIEVIGTVVDGEALTTSSFIDSGLKEGIYYYTVKAIDRAENHSLHSEIADVFVGIIE